MKTKILQLAFLLIYFNINAQIVNISDVNFKNRLINSNCVDNDNNGTLDNNADTNGDGEIQITEAEAITGRLYIGNANISDLTGIEAFINLIALDCPSNQLTDLDISQNGNLAEINCTSNDLTNLILGMNPNLIELKCGNNQLTGLDVTKNTNLEILKCWSNSMTDIDISNNLNLIDFSISQNPITSLDFNQNILLEGIECISTQISTLDISNNPRVKALFIQNNPNLTYVNLKNGKNHDLQVNPNFIDFSNLPALETACVDDIYSSFVTQLTNFYNLSSVAFTEYCSFSPSLSNNITGKIQFDTDNNGCSTTDFSVPNLLIVTDNGIEKSSSFTQSEGVYLMYTNEGNFTTEITSNLPNYFTITPITHTSNFVGFNNSDIDNFCINANQTINDLNISIIPLVQARPGFDSKYQLIYHNVGTEQLNGDIVLLFDASKLNFLTASETIASQTSNSIKFNYNSLKPFEIRTIDLNFNVLAPPTTNIGDILNFTATINPVSGDNTESDNIFELDQTVVGSYDPNDITVLEGPEISINQTDNYLHYVIRFQNTGTASAINVVVANNLDSNLDWTSLIVESLSHSNRVAIRNENEIEFIFENINLPDSTNDEPNSHGFIVYKIKPKNGIAIGDIIQNKADIFFDFNPAIITNTVNTEIVTSLSIYENESSIFKVYPNPTNSILNINSTTRITKLEVYNNIGQVVLTEFIKNQIDISTLNSGIYFIKIKDKIGNLETIKIIKK